MVNLLISFEKLFILLTEYNLSLLAGERGRRTQPKEVSQKMTHVPFLLFAAFVEA